MRTCRGGSAGRWRAIGLVVLGALAAAPAHGADLWGDLYLLGQVRDDYLTRDTAAPVDLYGNLGASRLWNSSQMETFFRLEQDLATGDNAGDFYAGYARVPNVIPGVEATVGRQFLSEAPGNVFVADAGRLQINQGWPVSFTLYGGRPEYFEPTYSSPIISQEEALFGGSIQTARMQGGKMTLGYQQWQREGYVLQQLVSASAVQTFSTLPAMPQLYATIAYDADHQNIDTATLGADLFFSAPVLLVNLASTYYRPQDQSGFVTDINKREDAIFQLFSESDLVQVRGGVRRPFTRELSGYADYSYQNYENAVDETQNGHLAHVGLQWLPEGDGLETVLLAYYLADSGGGNVNGMSFYYDNRVYERIVFRFRTDVAYYEKESNQSDWPVHTLTGLGYDLAPGLFGELLFEANRNAFFDADLRFGFVLTYQFRQQVGEPAKEQERS